MSNTAPARKGSSLRTPRTRAAPVIKSPTPPVPRTPAPGATPVSTPVPAAPPIAPEPTDSPGVVERINGFATRTRAAEEALANLQRELATERSARVTAERNAVLVGTNVKAPSVQRALRRGYDDYAAEAGDKAVDFGAWIETEAKTDPLFAPHFVVAAPVTPAPVTPAPVTPAPGVVAPVAPVVAPVAAPTPNPNGGAVPVTVQQGKVFSDAEVKAMDPATYSVHAPEIRRQLETGSDGLKVIMPPPRKKAP